MVGYINFMVFDILQAMNRMMLETTILIVRINLDEFM